MPEGIKLLLVTLCSINCSPHPTWLPLLHFLCSAIMVCPGGQPNTTFFHRATLRMAPAVLQTLGYGILTCVCISILQNKPGVACKVSCTQGAHFGFVSFSDVSKLMGKEMKGSKRPPETEGESFCGQTLLCTWRVEAECATPGLLRALCLPTADRCDVRG